MSGATLNDAIITGANFNNSNNCYETNEKIQRAFANPESDDVFYRAIFLF
jgi:hypothetical protein